MTPNEVRARNEPSAAMPGGDELARTPYTTTNTTGPVDTQPPKENA